MWRYYEGPQAKVGAHQKLTSHHRCSSRPYHEDLGRRLLPGLRLCNLCPSRLENVALFTNQTAQQLTVLGNFRGVIGCTKPIGTPELDQKKT